jgi:hypothetical protein
MIQQWKKGYRLRRRIVEVNALCKIENENVILIGQFYKNMLFIAVRPELELGFSQYFLAYRLQVH